MAVSIVARKTYLRTRPKMGDPPQRLQTENLEIGKTKEGHQRLLRLQVSEPLYPKLREMFVLTENEASKAVARFSVKLNFRKCCRYFADISKISYYRHGH